MVPRMDGLLKEAVAIDIYIYAQLTTGYTYIHALLCHTSMSLEIWIKFSPE